MTALPGRRVVGESLRNLLARPVLTVALVALVAAASAVSVLAEAGASVTARNYASYLLLNGYSTLLIQSKQDGGAALTMRHCAAFAAEPGVDAAVSLRTPQQQYHLFGPSGPSPPVQAVSGDVAAFLAATRPGRVTVWTGPVVIADRLAAVAVRHGDEPFQIRLAAGAHVSTVPAVAGDLTVLGAGAEGNLLVLDPTPGPVQTCAFLVDAPYRDSVIDAAGVVFPPTDGYVSQWALPNADKFQSPQSFFHARPTQWMWLAGGLAVIAFWALYLRLRRSEYALYAVAGLRVGRLWLLSGVELAVTAAVGLLLAAGVVAAAGWHADTRWSDMQVGASAGARLALLLVLAGIVLCAATAVGNADRTIDALKDR